MKLTTVFCALAVAAAAKASKAQDDSQGADSQGSDGDQGYGTTAQESYGAPAMAYSAPSYEAAAAPAYVAAPKCCVHNCPSHAPFFSEAQCGCVAGVQYAAPAYAVASYAQPTSYAQQQQGGYRNLQAYAAQQSYGAPALAAPAVTMHQPRGTVDTRTLHVGRAGRICLWIGFIILFISAWTFINRSLRYHFYGDHENHNLRLSAFLSCPAMVEGFVCLIASLADLIASVVDGGFKWFFFGFAMLTFLPVIHYICWLRSKVVDARFDYSLFFWNYSTMANLTAFAWFAYPIVWILCEGTSVISADGEAIIYTVLDLISKAVLGMFIINARSVWTWTSGEIALELIWAALDGAAVSYRK